MPVFLPTSIDDALATMAEHPRAQPVAGGTDLLVGINAGRTPVHTVVALHRVAELRTWRRDGDRVIIGSGVTFTALAEPELAALVPALALAARTVGSPQIRNAGTIGGNIATASPAGDTLPVLVALDAEVVLRSVAAERTLPIGAFLLGPTHTDRRPDELIVGVRVPVVGGPQEFLKVGTRNAMVISVAGLAAVADLRARTMRVALGSVGPTVLRAVEAEAYAERHIDWTAGSTPDPGTATVFGALVAQAARPIDDHRSSAAYRTHAVEVLGRRALSRMFPPTIATGDAAAEHGAPEATP